MSTLNAGKRSERITVYYDGDCPLCLREIGFYQQRRGACEIRWIDLAAQQGEWAAPDLRRSEALERFHVRLADGRLVDGARAFTEVWRALPAFRVAGSLLSTRPVLWLLEPLYTLFLRFRPRLQRLVGSRALKADAAACAVCGTDTTATAPQNGLPSRLPVRDGQ